MAFSSREARLQSFYNLILSTIYISELVIVRFLFPVINVYIMVQMLGNLTEEDLFPEIADLLKKAVTWTLQYVKFACIVGVNVVQRAVDLYDRYGKKEVRLQGIGRGTSRG